MLIGLRQQGCVWPALSFPDYGAYGDKASNRSGCTIADNGFSTSIALRWLAFIDSEVLEIARRAANDRTTALQLHC